MLDELKVIKRMVNVEIWTVDLLLWPLVYLASAYLPYDINLYLQGRLQS